MPSPYEQYMQALAGGQNGAPFGSRDSVMRMGRRPMGGAPFGMSPMGMPGQGPGTAPPAGPKMMDANAIDGYMNPGNNSDANMMRPKLNFDPASGGRVGPGGPVPGTGPQMPGTGPMNLGGMAKAGNQPSMLGGENPMLKLGGMAGLMQGLANKGAGGASAGGGIGGLLKFLMPG